VLAFLTLAFGVASITGEQRDKVIWQTVTKPVAAWQYLLGKWLGVVGLNAVLLVVASSGIFLFTEYLRNAAGDRRDAGVPLARRGVSEDRFILESRVLTARKSVDMEIPEDLSRSTARSSRSGREYIAAERLTDPEFAQTPDELEYVADQLRRAPSLVPRDPPGRQPDLPDPRAGRREERRQPAHASGADRRGGQPPGPRSTR
jgi:hypothetical protein